MHVGGIGTKKTMVYEAAKLLEHRYQSEIKVSDVAALCHCSPATIYKRFGNLEYLLYVASIGFLEDYMQEFKGIQENGKPMFDRYLAGWIRFNKYAFKSPDVYIRLFWGEHSDKFSDAVGEYFELFPQFSEDNDRNLFYRVFFANGDMRQRDLILLSIASKQGALTMKAAEFLSITNPILVESHLRKVVAATDAQKAQAEEECNSLIIHNSQISRLR